ncbi:MAG: hypothetical protein R2877_06205 [Bdellovibrionota bacterium]
MMNLRPYILTLFYTFVAVFALQACGVDPLDPAGKFGKNGLRRQITAGH